MLVKAAHGCERSAPHAKSGAAGPWRLQRDGVKMVAHLARQLPAFEPSCLRPGGCRLVQGNEHLRVYSRIYVQEQQHVSLARPCTRVARRAKAHIFCPAHNGKAAEFRVFGTQLFQQRQRAVLRSVICKHKMQLIFRVMRRSQGLHAAAQPFSLL